MGTFSNKAIVQELKQRNRLGCVHLADAFQARLMNEAVSVFHVSAEDAEELVSDVLLAVVKGIDTFQFKRGDSDFTVWVITIFRNRVRDFIRHKALTHGLVGRYEESELEVEGRTGSTEREVLGTIVRRYEEAVRSSEGAAGGAIAGKLMAIADALERLESWERVLLRCRALDVPYEDIAEYTGKPVAQLKVYHARVKKKFVVLLAETYPELLHDEKRTG